MRKAIRYIVKTDFILRLMYEQGIETQKELAQKAGIDEDTLSAWLNGRSARKSNLSKLAKALGRSRWTEFVDFLAPEDTPQHIEQISPTIFDTDHPKSGFATKEEDFRTVLALRREFFARQVIVPDDAYRKCHATNRFSMKVVYSAENEPIGFWAIVPVSSSDVLDDFAKKGKGSHRDMLTTHCIDWSEIDPTSTYLYIIGAVVPYAGDPKKPVIRELQTHHARILMLDAFSFAIRLIDTIQIHSVCGYPSRDGGKAALDHIFGSPVPNAYADDDVRQPIYYADTNLVRNHVKLEMERFLHRRTTLVPVWDPHDQNAFDSQLPSN